METPQLTSRAHADAKAEAVRDDSEVICIEFTRGKRRVYRQPAAAASSSGGGGQNHFDVRDDAVTSGHHFGNLVGNLAPRCDDLEEEKKKKKKKVKKTDSVGKEDSVVASSSSSVVLEKEKKKQYKEYVDLSSSMETEPKKKKTKLVSALDKSSKEKKGSLDHFSSSSFCSTASLKAEEE